MHNNRPKPHVAPEVTKVALDTLKSTTIARAIALAKLLNDEIKPRVDGLVIIYDTATIGLKFTITQADLNEAASLSGLTKAQLDDALYVITTLLAPQMETGYTALAHLAARG